MLFLELAPLGGLIWTNTETDKKLLTFFFSNQQRPARDEVRSCWGALVCALCVCAWDDWRQRERDGTGTQHQCFDCTLAADVTFVSARLEQSHIRHPSRLLINAQLSSFLASCQQFRLLGWTVAPLLNLRGFASLPVLCHLQLPPTLPYPTQPIPTPSPHSTHAASQVEREISFRVSAGCLKVLTSNTCCAWSMLSQGKSCLKVAPFFECLCIHTSQHASEVHHFPPTSNKNPLLTYIEIPHCNFALYALY